MKNFFKIALLIVAITACQTNPTAAPATAANPPTSTSTAGGNSPSPVPATNTPAASSPASPTAAAPRNCTDNAKFVADVAVQDNDQFEPGEKIHKIWRVQNSGDCAWNSAYTLVFLKGSQMGAPDEMPLTDTAPGAVLDIAVDMTAPETNSAYRADFEIRTPSGAIMPIDQDTRLWLIIRVSNEESHVDLGSGGDSTTTSAGPGFATVSCSYTTDQSRVEAVFAALNAYRAQQGLPPYTLNDQLSTAAQAHAADMACNNLFYHNGSNGSTPKSRVAASGYVASAVTENVYGSYPPLSSTEAITWWANDLTDPRHNENLLSMKYIEVGIGYAFFDNFGYYVIDFAVP